MDDKRDVLKYEQPFSYKILKEGKAQIFFKNRLTKIIVGKDFSKLENIIIEDDIYEIQLFFAKITGQVKHGNEKQGKRS